MLLVLHVQIRHLSKDLACHPSLAFPLLANCDSQPKIIVVHVTPPAIFLVAVAFQRSALANDSLLAPDIATVGDSVQGIPLLLGEWDSLQGVPPLQSEWDSLQGVPPLQSERDSLQGIPPLQSGGVSLQGTLFHLDFSTHPVLRLVMALLRDPHRGLLLPVHLPLLGTIRKLTNLLFQPPVRAMIDFILKSFPDAQASPSHPSSRSFDLSAYAGITDTAIPPGSLLAWCHALSDAFSDTQQRFAHRIKDGKVCHTLLPTLNKFERVSNSPTQGKELKANPDVLDLLRNRVPDNRHVPMSLKEAVAVERSLRSGLKSHNFLTWSVVALIRSLHEKKLLPKDDPVISQLQKSFSKAYGNVASCMTSSAAFVTLKRRQLLLSHVVPSVYDAQKRNLLSDPFFQTSSLFSAASVEAARSAARDLSLFKPHLKASSSTTTSRRPAYSSSSAQRGPARSSSRQSSAQRPSSPLRQQSGKKGDSRFQKKSSGPHQKRGGGGGFGGRSLVPHWRSAAA